MPQLFMLLLGCKPPGRHTEQHDIFFGIGESVKDLLPAVVEFWPEANGRIHVDAWRPVTQVDGYAITVVEKQTPPGPLNLFFLNLGGYKPNEFDEFHYKVLAVAPDKGEAVRQAKATAFFRHTGYRGAAAHIDDKYGVDVDDVEAIPDILPPADKHRYRLLISPNKLTTPADAVRLGYMRLDAVEEWGRL